ncbi:SIMPL domain-containing protein [Protaetiibacter larvae]|uniref:SIMPL domain-containing protein n=1 Tax=Protaetiibacter larvae TaxID=2592654 RepID=A0A5C1Y9A3_9MICO|nr:SIMPL domain-containing protein [Protaetiibacter larvae]QEO10451.1 SIMPL domain-containing protein [Protaetiibacter larvae]
MSTLITVQGSFSAWYPAERATVRISIGFDGATRDTVLGSATATAKTVVDSVTAIHDPDSGPVTWWSSDRVRVWADRPWNNEGKQLPLVHHATIGVTVKFKDFDALADWLIETAAVSGVQVNGIEWALTESKRTSVTTEVRSRAVKDAADKARVFAQAIGLGQLTAVAIADPGMLGVSGVAPLPAPPLLRAAAFKTADNGANALDFTPEDIEVSAAVDARFEAS